MFSTWSAFGERRGDSAAGLGTIALAQLLRADTPAAKPHFAPRAKSIIFLFMEGGPSQVDLFDPKPALQRLDGSPLPESMRAGLRFAFIKQTAKVWASRRPFAWYGQSGMEFSDWLPHLATYADDRCMVRSMYSDQFNHHPGQLLLHCGSPLVGRPALGSWLLYGLGSESQNLPRFVVLTSGRGSSSSSGLFSSGFLPSLYSGVPFAGSGEAIPYLGNPPGVSRREQRARLDGIRTWNENHRGETGEPEIDSRIASYELAFRMQSAAPELLDLGQESAATRALYGLDQEPTRAFGANGLLARRMVELGVRCVLVLHATWDDHASLTAGHQRNCRATDQPSAA